MNSSSVRSRGSLLATLKEATLSHQVSTQYRAGQPAAVGPCRPPLTEVVRSSGQSAKEGGGSGRKKARGRDGLLSFFRPGQTNGREGEREVAAVKPSQGSSHGNGRPVALEAYTVILLEEVIKGVPLPSPSYPTHTQVDVLFDSDRGFWSGVYELIATTRRPLILTCNGHYTAAVLALPLTLYLLSPLRSHI